MSFQDSRYNAFYNNNNDNNLKPNEQSDTIKSLLNAVTKTLDNSDKSINKKKEIKREVREEPREIRETKEIREPREIRESKESKEVKEIKEHEIKKSKEPKEIKEPKESKELKEQIKESKESKEQIKEIPKIVTKKTDKSNDSIDTKINDVIDTFGRMSLTEQYEMLETNDKIEKIDENYDDLPDLIPLINDFKPSAIENDIKDVNNIDKMTTTENIKSTEDTQEYFKYEQLINNLGFLASVNKNDKLVLFNGNFNNDKMFIPSILRYWFGQSRETTYDGLEKLIISAEYHSNFLIEQIKKENNPENKKDLSIKLNDLTLNLDASTLGLNNLLITYSDDKAYFARLGTCIKKFHYRVSKNMETRNI
jgi:hypothetical protein